MKKEGTIISGRQSNIQVWVLATLIIFVDQIVKIFVTNSDTDYMLNGGVAFGIFGTSFPLGFLLNLAGIVLILFIIGKVEKTVLMPLSVLLGAGTSNLIDRVARGGVVDYLDLGFLPKFNLADLLITASSIIIVILLFKKNLQTKNATK